MTTGSSKSQSDIVSDFKTTCMIVFHREYNPAVWSFSR